MTKAHVEAHQRALEFGRTRCIEDSVIAIVKTEPPTRDRRLMEMMGTNPSYLTVAGADIG